MTVPQLTPEQLAAARAAASQARRARADLRAKVSNGELSLAEALDIALADDVLANLPVDSLLRALPRIGEKRAHEVMERLDIAANRRIRGLGHRQLSALKAEFE